MSTGNINNPGEAIILPSVLAPSAAPPATATTPAGVADAPTTLAPSQQSQEADAADASVPVMPYPTSFQFFTEVPANATGLTGAQIMSLGESKAILSMLDNWRESLAQQGEEMRKASLDPENIRKAQQDPVLGNVISALVVATNNQTPAATPGIEGPASKTSALDGTSAAMQSSMESFVPLMTVGLIFAGAGGVKDAMMIDTLSTSMVGVNPTSNRAPEIALYKSDMRAELGLLGAAMMQGAAYVANATAIEKGDSAKINPEQTAKNYAEEILKIVNSGVLTSLVTAIMTQKSEKGAPANPAMVKTLTAQLTTILLATALAGLYKSAKEGGTGWLTGAEFDGMISGQNDISGHKHAKTMHDLLDKIKTNLASLPDKGEAMRDYLHEFFDGNPALSVLTDPAKVFAQILPSIKRSINQNPA